jgi:hypothetical protein
MWDFDADESFFFVTSCALGLVGAWRWYARLLRRTAHGRRATPTLALGVAPLVALLASPAACRIMRFDFHLTSEGWRVSEVNSDVPGGFAEAGASAAMVAENVSLAGDPAAAYVDTLFSAKR